MVFFNLKDSLIIQSLNYDQADNIVKEHILELF